MTTSYLQLDPFNLRLSAQPLRCLTGVEIPPGLVGFCWDTPVSDELLAEQAPLLASVLGTLVDLGRSADDPEHLARLARAYVEMLDSQLGAVFQRPRSLPLPWQASPTAGGDDE